MSWVYGQDSFWGRGGFAARSVVLFVLSVGVFFPICMLRTVDDKFL
jgi:hypothetical protein